jgi:type IV pilus assembly protein PilF
MKRIFCAVLGTTLALYIAGCTTSSPSLGKKDSEAAASYNLQLGVDYLRQGNLSSAKEKIDRSLEQNSHNAQAHGVAGLLYDRLGETRKAEEHFSRAVSLDPNDSELMNYYAQFLCSRGDRDKGEQLALKAAANPLYKTPEVAYLNAGLCALSAKQNERAEKYFRGALAVQPNFAEALFQMAQLELSAGNYLPARGFLQRYMQATPTTATALWLGVRIEKALGNNSTAADYARRLKNDFPTANETKELIASERQPG